jgi:hypothetical protein
MRELYTHGMDGTPLYMKMRGFLINRDEGAP